MARRKRPQVVGANPILTAIQTGKSVIGLKGYIPLTPSCDCGCSDTTVYAPAEIVALGVDNCDLHLKAKVVGAFINGDELITVSPDSFFPDKTSIKALHAKRELEAKAKAFYNALTASTWATNRRATVLKRLPEELTKAQIDIIEAELQDQNCSLTRPGQLGSGTIYKVAKMITRLKFDLTEEQVESIHWRTS